MRITLYFEICGTYGILFASNHRTVYSSNFLSSSLPISTFSPSGNWIKSGCWFVKKSLQESQAEQPFPFLQRTW